MPAKGYLDPNIFYFDKEGNWIKKHCSKCKRVLFKNDFAPDIRKGCGRTAQCRECRNEVYRKNEKERAKSEAHREKQRRKNRRTVTNYSRERYEELKAYNREYHKNRLLIDETFRLWHLERCRNWWAKTKNGKAAQKAKNHNQRMRRKNVEGIITPEMIKRIETKNREKYGVLTCVYCNRNVETGYDLDHKIAIINGGKNIFGNLCISCKECNASKGAMSHTKFFKSERLKRIVNNKELEIAV